MRPADDAPGATEPQAARHEPVVELGWLVAHALDTRQRASVQAARRQVLAALEQALPEFRWRMPLVEWDEPLLTPQEEPVALLKEGARQRAQHHWDYALVITPADLAAYSRPQAMAAPSRSLYAAVLSLARIGARAAPTAPETETSAAPPGAADAADATDGALVGDDDSPADPVAVRRIVALVMHLLGDLNDLPHSEAPDSYMHLPAGPAALDAMRHFDEEQRLQLREELQATADVRLEELPRAARQARWRFYLRALWIGREEVASAVLQAHPWQFPFRLSGLSTAALSTLIVLLTAAEGWELGMSQPAGTIVALSLLALLGTCAFIIHRQRLLLHPPRSGPLTEQVVFSNAAVVIVVLLGMLITYLALFGLALTLSQTLYPDTLVRGWAASLEGAITLRHYLSLAGFTAATGIIIGALGASFEGQQYFQHVAFVDEEL